ncbi:MAG: UvrD-helicase domain-containing protein [Patescibacteria group bacterium]
MELNERQREAVEAPEGPLLIVAGAGSGKTKTLTARLTRFIERGTGPGHILAITFTNKAAHEMRERVTNNLQLKTSDKEVSGFKSSVISSPFIGTFHAFGASILRREAHLLDRTERFTIFDDDDTMRVLRRITKGDGDKSTARKTGADASRMIGKVKSRLLDPEEALDGKELAIWNVYEEALAGMNAFDFDDLIEKVVRLFQAHPEVLRRYQDQWTHILVDEYQDVNPAQYELVRALASRHKNLSVVGDDAQAIYGWRHADFRNFLNFEMDWPGAKVVKLEQSYRSSGTIVGAASALIAENKLQKPKSLWTKNPEGGLIAVASTRTPDEEARFIAEKIGFLLARKERAAVLYRTNAQSRAIEQALIAADIPYRIFGGLRFYERAEIKDVVAGVRLIVNPRDAVARNRLEKNLRVRAFRSLTERIAGVSDSLPPLELVTIVIEATGYLDFLKSSFANAEERIENLRELATFASSFKDAAEFLERITLLQAIDEPKGTLTPKPYPLSTVSLMTIHLAKGLEFDHVFVAGVAEGTLPHERSYRGDDIEEERRLMYVAMTRARQSLTLTFSRIPSRFLYEIPPELTSFTNLVGGDPAFPEDEDIVYLDEE